MTAKGRANSTRTILRMRGGLFHNHLVSQAAVIFREAGCVVRCEQALTLKGGQKVFVDLLACRAGLVLAGEVETTARHAGRAGAKARSLNVPVWLIVPSRRVRAELLRKIGPLAPDRDVGPIQILLPGELAQRLSSPLKKGLLTHMVL